MSKLTPDLISRVLDKAATLAEATRFLEMIALTPPVAVPDVAPTAPKPRPSRAVERQYPPRPWTEDEDATLRAYWGADMSALEGVFKRSQGAIRLRAKALGIKQ